MTPRLAAIALIAGAVFIAAACGGGPNDGAGESRPEAADTGSEAAPGATATGEPSGQPTPEPPVENPAPEFPAGLTWFNVSEPLSFEKLRGKLVLLDFWTQGCINCQHIIPDLERLEEEFADSLVVIGGAHGEVLGGTEGLGRSRGNRAL